LDMSEENAFSDANRYKAMDMAIKFLLLATSTLILIMVSRS
jgi:hypothetical protein